MSRASPPRAEEVRQVGGVEPSPTWEIVHHLLKGLSGSGPSVLEAPLDVTLTEDGV